jgi:hypothetical protein
MPTEPNAAPRIALGTNTVVSGCLGSGSPNSGSPNSGSPNKEADIMVTATCEEVRNQALNLSLDEQLRLIEELAGIIRLQPAPRRKRRVVKRRAFLRS